MRVPDGRHFWHANGYIMRRAFIERPPGSALGGAMVAERLPIEDARAIAHSLAGMPITEVGPVEAQMIDDMTRALKAITDWRIENIR